MAKKPSDNFYKRDPKKALQGMIGLTLEERGVYNTLIDMMYDMWRPLAWHTPNERQYLVQWMGAAAQKVNPIIKSLIAKGRVREIEIEGRTYLSDDLFEEKRAEFKGKKAPEDTAGKSVDVGGKSVDVAAKSDEVAEKSRLCENESEQNQHVTPLEKNKKRIEEDKRKSKRKGSGSALDEEREPPPKWEGDPTIREAFSRRYGEGFALSFIDTARPGPGEGVVIARTITALQKLNGCELVRDLKLTIKPP